jgi:hypothetical protein
LRCGANDGLAAGDCDVAAAAEHCRVYHTAEEM